jgi:hypothetical protein
MQKLSDVRRTGKKKVARLAVAAVNQASVWRGTMRKFRTVSAKGTQWIFMRAPQKPHSVCENGAK